MNAEVSPRITSPTISPVLLGPRDRLLHVRKAKRFVHKCKDQCTNINTLLPLPVRIAAARVPEHPGSAISYSCIFSFV